jgi:very-short-patch-repair endonuclease
MRHKPTEAEKYLWQYLRDRKLDRFKFRRQHTLGQFIVDFYCEEANLVIELDGPVHEYLKIKDTARQEYLQSHEYTVLRFTNDQIIHNIGNVVRQITLSLNQAMSFPLSASGERVRE